MENNQQRTTKRDQSLHEKPLREKPRGK